VAVLVAAGCSELVDVPEGASMFEVLKVLESKSMSAVPVYKVTPPAPGAGGDVPAAVTPALGKALAMLPPRGTRTYLGWCDAMSAVCACPCPPPSPRCPCLCVCVAVAHVPELPGPSTK
jgi:hypothetical protein